MGPRQPEFIEPTLPAPSLEGMSVGGEILPLGGGDRHERQEAHRVETNTQPAVAMPALPTPATPQPLVQTSVAPIVDNTMMNPVVASDDDLIEKEWVDKAKMIIAETKDDPYKREMSIKALQLDYIKKRYGRVIGATNDQEET